jgi:hypothetical protein
VAKSAVVIKHRYNPDPRLSANQMAQYIEAGAQKRYTILQDAKFPPTFMLIRYEDAVAPIVGHSTGKADALEHGILKLKRKEVSDDLSEYTRENCRLCIDALESFRATIENLDLGKTVFRPCELRETRMDIKGVDVSVSLRLMTEEVKRGGKRSIGAAILSYSKAKNPRELEAMAMLIYRYLKAQPKYAEECVPQLCMAIDVPNATIYRAGAAQARLWKTVEASCSEVKRVWPTVEPPRNYNGPPIVPRAA